MSLVEQAAKRLEQLRKAGEQVSGDLAYPKTGEPSDAAPKSSNTIERIALKLEGLQQSPPAPPEPAPAPKAPPAASPQPEVQADAFQPKESERREPTFKSSMPPLPSAPRSPGPLPMFRAGDPRRARVEEIDLARLASRGVLTPAAADSRLANELRVIKRPLINNCIGKSAGRIKHANRIMITSALPGEGKSFVATNLAMSIAMERDSTVLLVEADTGRSSLANLLGIPAGKGLMDVLASPGTDVAEVLVKTNVGRLSFLPAGNRHEHATELLASATMERLVDHLASRYSDRVVIFDAPPLLATPEARVLSRYMGQIVLVVEAEGVTHGTVLQALSTVETCPVVMTVLNKVSTLEDKFYYYSG